MDGLTAREALAATMLLASTAFAGAGVYAQAGIDRACDRRVRRLLTVPGNLCAAVGLAIALVAAWPSPGIRVIVLAMIVMFVTLNALVVRFLGGRIPRVVGDHMPIAIGVNAAMAMAAYVILSR
jgi:hypothetical protein